MHKALVALLLLSCRSPTVVRADPAIADAAVDAPKATVLAHEMRGYDVIDLDRGVVRFTVKNRAGASDKSDAFALLPDNTIRAYRLSDGSERWTRVVRDARDLIVQDDTNVYVLGTAAVVAIRKATGDAHEISSAVGPPSRIGAFGGVLAIAYRSSVSLHDNKTFSSHGSLTLPFDLLGWHAGIYPTSEPATACAMNSPRGAFEVVCFAANGAPRATAKAISGQMIVSVSERYALYASVYSPPRGATVIRLSDGATFAVADQVAAVIERSDGSLEGLLVVKPELRMLEPTGALRWRAPAAHHYGDAASAVMRDGRLYVDVYSTASSGSSLAAYELATGKLLWKADVEQLPIAHSEYFCEVRLELRGDRVLLRGDESSVTTTQSFALSDGTRAWAISHHR